MRRLFCVVLLCVFASGASAQMLQSIVGGPSGAGGGGGGTITFTSLTNNAAGTQAALVGTYTNSAPSGLTSQSWGGGTGCSGTPAVTSFVATGGNITANVAALSTGDIGCTFTATGTGANTGTATSPGAVVWPSGIALVAHVQIPGALNGGTSAGIRTTGSTLLLLSVSQYTGATLTGPTDARSGCASPCNAWTGLTGQNQTTEDYNRLFYVGNPTVGTTHAFTVANTGIASITNVATFSGVTTSTPFDVQNGATGFLVSSLATGSVTPSAANSLIVSGTAANTPTAGAYTINTGFTITDQGAFSGGVNEGGGLAYLVQSGGPTPVNPTWTYPGTPSSIAATIAVFK